MEVMEVEETVEEVVMEEIGTAHQPTLGEEVGAPTLTQVQAFVFPISRKCN